VFAADVKAVLAGLGPPPERVAAALGVHRGEPTVLVVLEEPPEAWLADVEPLLRRRIEGVRVVVRSTRRGTVARTTSGKPKRRELWLAYVTGQLSGGEAASIDALHVTGLDHAGIRCFRLARTRCAVRPRGRRRY
jgi:hypothetical protein